MAIPAKTGGSWERFRLLKFMHKLCAIEFICMHEVEAWLDELGENSNSN